MGSEVSTEEENDELDELEEGQPVKKKKPSPTPRPPRPPTQVSSPTPRSSVVERRPALVAHTIQKVTLTPVMVTAQPSPSIKQTRKTHFPIADFQPNYKRPISIAPLDVNTRIQPVIGVAQTGGQGHAKYAHFVRPYDIEYKSLLLAPGNQQRPKPYRYYSKKILRDKPPYEHINIHNERPSPRGQVHTYPARHTPINLRSNSSVGYYRPIRNAYPSNGGPAYFHSDMNHSNLCNPYPLGQYPQRSIPVIQAEPIVHNWKRTFPNVTNRRWPPSNQRYMY